MTTEAIPTIPPGLQEAIKNESLIVFIGAGLSSYVGMKNWKELKEELIDKCRPKQEFNAEDFKAELRSHWNNYECFQLLKSHDPINYDDVINRLLRPKSEQRNKFKEIISFVKALSPRSIVTLNVDQLLMDHAGFNADEVRHIGACYPWELSQGKLFYFHGILPAVGEMEGIRRWVFNDFDLQDRYTKGDSSQFLHALFGGQYTILFLGFSFSDELLLSHAKLPDTIRKEIEQGIRPPLHYNLALKAENKKIILKHLYGVETIEYEPVEGTNKYLNFERTLKKWSEQINATEAVEKDELTPPTMVPKVEIRE